MYKPGQKIRCVDASGTYNQLSVNTVYTVDHMLLLTGEWFVHLCEVRPHEAGWFPSRFREDDQSDFKGFMDRVLKPVDLGQPVTA